MDRKVLVLPLALVLAGGVTACSVDVRGESTPPVYEKLQVSTPLDEFLPTRRDTEMLQRAEARLANSCLKRLSYTENPMPEVRAASSEASAHPEFIVFSLRQAQDLGYSQPPASKSPGKSWDSKSSRVQQELMNGNLKEYKGSPVPEGGCTREVARHITRGADGPTTIRGGGVEITQQQDAAPTGLGEAHVGIIRLDAIGRVKQDVRVKSVVGQWSACMRANGYSYNSPEDAANDGRWAGRRVDALERATATADMKCKKDVNYLGVVVAVQSMYEKQVIEERREELDTLRANIRTWVSNAASVGGT